MPRARGHVVVYLVRLQPEIGLREMMIVTSTSIDSESEEDSNYMGIENLEIDRKFSTSTRIYARSSFRLLLHLRRKLLGIRGTTLRVYTV